MRYNGRITNWNDDRGFGFITPNEGGKAIFVHISAFKKNQRRPIGNELVTYELFNDPKKGFRAQNVMFFDVQKVSVKTKNYLSFKHLMLAIALLIGVVTYVWVNLSTDNNKYIPPVTSKKLEVESKPRFQCEGKRFCSEMTSCEEATFYLKNCPNVEIDGDRDGIPCESQFCDK